VSPYACLVDFVGEGQGFVNKREGKVAADDGRWFSAFEAGGIKALCFGLLPSSLGGQKFGSM
jgi:hypothetical protein